MAYRRRHGITRASTFKEEIYRPPPPGYGGDSSSFPSSSSSSSLAAQAIRASAAHRDSSLSSAYADSAFHSSFKDHRSKPQDGSPTYDFTTMKSSNEAGGFWGVLARKAKAILEEDNLSDHPQFQTTTTRIGAQPLTSSRADQFYQSYQPSESSRKMENPTLRKSLDALTTSLNQIGDSIGIALEEGRTMVESKTADILQETRKLQIRRRGIISEDQNQVSGVCAWQQSTTQSTEQHMQTSQEDQLKASRDVAMATAAKAKLLLRELKTVKADLAFAKQRCSQLEEENRILREAREKGDYPADDDMIRLQLETLLAEKARLAHENSVYARENRFLREIVEYHQLTMQDVVYLDEGIEEFTEVYPIPAVSRMLSASPPSPSSPNSQSPESSPSRSTKELQQKATTDVQELSRSPPVAKQLQQIATTDVPQSEAPPSSRSPLITSEDSTKQ